MAYNTIILKGTPVNLERVAAAAFTPGHLLELTTADKFQKHSNADQDVTPKLFAIEDALQGNEIGDDYSANNEAQAALPRPGDEIYAWLAQGETVSIGTKLSSNGDGTLKAYTNQALSSAEAETIYPEAVIGIALEALDLSTSADVATRFKIMIV